MGYQAGTVGPIAYYQDNSGNANDTDTTINCKPDQFGAPPGAQIITGTAQVNQHASRGKAYVHNETITPEGISFMVYTQAANDSWFFGWHSGAITVTTSFQWYYITDTAVEGGDGFFTHQAPAALPNAALACLRPHPRAGTGYPGPQSYANDLSPCSSRPVPTAAGTTEVRQKQKFCACPHAPVRP